MTHADVFAVMWPGLQTTIQDAGRRGYRAAGVPISGACDSVSLAVANLLIGNDAGAAALECTLIGPELEVLVDTLIGIGGADLGARVRRSGRRLAPGASYRVAAGDIIEMPGSASDGGGRNGPAGMRAYVAVPGGFDVPLVLGSRSTSLVGGFGGLAGRPMRAGDLLRATRGAGELPAAAQWPADIALTPLDAPVRILPAPGIHRSETTDGPRAALAALVATPWTVASASDRRGLRLEGPPLPIVGRADAPSHGVVPGTVQVTPDGQPLVLLSDGGTTGGYPVLGIAITADLGILGQASPGREVRFVSTTPAEARAAAIELRARLEEAERRLAEDGASGAAGADWDDLADFAGG